MTQTTAAEFKGIQYGQWVTVDGTDRAMVTDWYMADGYVVQVRVHVTAELRHLNSGHTNGWLKWDRISELSDYLDPNHA